MQISAKKILAKFDLMNESYDLALFFRYSTNIQIYPSPICTLEKEEKYGSLLGQPKRPIAKWYNI